MEAAVVAVTKGASIRSASLQYQIPRTTLRSRFQSIGLCKYAYKAQQRLLDVKKAYLARWVRL